MSGGTNGANQEFTETFRCSSSAPIAVGVDICLRLGKSIGDMIHISPGVDIDIPIKVLSSPVPPLAFKEKTGLGVYTKIKSVFIMLGKSGSLCETDGTRLILRRFCRFFCFTTLNVDIVLCRHQNAVDKCCTLRLKLCECILLCIMACRRDCAEAMSFTLFPMEASVPCVSIIGFVRCTLCQ